MHTWVIEQAVQEANGRVEQALKKKNGAKAGWLERMNRPAFWDDPERFATLDRLERVDRADPRGIEDDGEHAVPHGRRHLRHSRPRRDATGQGRAEHRQAAQGHRAGGGAVAVVVGHHHDAPAGPQYAALTVSASPITAPTVCSASSSRAIRRSRIATRPIPSARSTPVAEIAAVSTAGRAPMR